MNHSIDSRLYDSQLNKENFESFMTDYGHNPETFVAFLGSGIGASLDDVPDVKELYTNCCTKYKVSEKPGSEFPSMFSDLYQEVDKVEDFDRYVFDTITPKKAKATTTHIQIAPGF